MLQDFEDAIALFIKLLACVLLAVILFSTLPIWLPISIIVLIISKIKRKREAPNGAIYNSIREDEQQ